jgi:hypothetical protein
MSARKVVARSELVEGRASRNALILSAVCGLCIFLSAKPADAHPAPFSYVDLRLQPGLMQGSIVAHVFDVAHDLNIGKPDQLLDPAFASQQSQAFAALMAPRLTVTADGQVLAAEWSEIDVIPDRQSIRIHVRYRLARAPGRVAVNAALFPYDPAHQTFLNLYDGDALTQAILDISHSQFEYFAGTRQGALAVMRQFVPAGVTHVAMGADHLLFLLGLLLLGGSTRKLVLIVTAFTVAHSITMSLAALSLVMPPPRIIDPAIALSIVYVGTDNLLVQGGRDVRAWIAFTFGFIHGFGFAGVLREMHLPPRALGWSLFSFNVGIEIGQLVVVLVAGAALMALRRRNELLGRRLAFAGSLVVVAAGTFWFIERVFFPAGLS